MQKIADRSALKQSLTHPSTYKLIATTQPQRQLVELAMNCLKLRGRRKHHILYAHNIFSSLRNVFRFFGVKELSGQSLLQVEEDAPTNHSNTDLSSQSGARLSDFQRY